MHEMSLVRTAVQAVLEECAGKGVTKVKTVDFSIGEMRDVIEAYVPDLFRYLARDTIAADAEVRIKRIPVRVRCRDCGEIFPIDVRGKGARTCPRCGSEQNYSLFSGMEFKIDSIEVDCERADGLGPTLVSSNVAA